MRHATYWLWVWNGPVQRGSLYLSNEGG
jgi:hypothetical protein